MIRIAVFCVVPSPYQRDLLQAIHKANRGKLSVFYLETNAPDSPWHTSDLEPWERILPGFSLGRGRVRCHFNQSLPDLQNFDLVVLNLPLTAATFQLLARRAPQQGWFFWGELMRSHRGGWKGAAQGLLATPIQRRAGGIFAIGERAVTSYQNYFPRLPVTNLPYCADVTPFSPPRDSGTLDGIVSFLFCGQLIARKGIDVLLAAFSELVSKHPAVRLRLVGREDQVRRQLESLSPEVVSKIDLIGFRQPSELPPLFHSSDVFVLPSRHDGWGVVINQAIGAHLPIIASAAVGAAADLVEDGVNGFIVPPSDKERLLEAMSELASSPPLRSDFSKASAAKSMEITPQSGAKIFWDTLEAFTS